MTIHPSDEDLILHYYSEGERGPEEARGVDEHLRACPTCQAAWTELKDVLALVDAAEVPEPGASFEPVMWARVARALPRRRASWWSVERLVPFAAMAAVLVGVIAVGYAWRSIRPAVAPASAVSAPASAATSAASSARLREQVLLTALDEHFEQTQLLLVELMNAPEDAHADFAFERATAADLVASGRLYRLTARETGDARLVGMLDDLELVLVDVARRPDRLDREELRSLRARISDGSLLFKVRAATNEIRERERRSVISE
jgi:anti-sigma factor RsiW